VLLAIAPSVEAMVRLPVDTIRGLPRLSNESDDALATFGRATSDVFAVEYEIVELAAGRSSVEPMRGIAVSEPPHVQGEATRDAPERKSTGVDMHVIELP
jgi:hypothetical protein